MLRNPNPLGLVLQASLSMSSISRDKNKRPMYNKQPEAVLHNTSCQSMVSLTKLKQAHS